MIFKFLPVKAYSFNAPRSRVFWCQPASCLSDLERVGAGTINAYGNRVNRSFRALMSEFLPVDTKIAGC